MLVSHVTQEPISRMCELLKEGVAVTRFMSF